MLSNIEAGGKTPYHQEVPGVRGKRIVIVGNCEVIKATSALLAGQGAQVFFAAENDEELGDLLAVVAQVRGEGEGMVASLEFAEDMHSFFNRAKRQLGQVDVLVYQPLGVNSLPDGGKVLVDSIIQHMRLNGGGHIIAISPSGSQRAADMRRRATSSGIRVTRIEPAAECSPWTADSQATDVANCVYESIAQPFAGDVVFMQDPFQEQFGGQIL